MYGQIFKDQRQGRAGYYDSLIHSTLSVHGCKRIFHEQAEPLFARRCKPDKTFSHLIRPATRAMQADFE